VILSRAQRQMLANAKAYAATVSRQAEIAKDPALAHALADVVAELHRIIAAAGGRPPLRLHQTDAQVGP
jgi:hypothetical protein